MPVIDMMHQRAVFSARFVGRIEEEHARFWLDCIAHLSGHDCLPIALVVDALKASDISSAAQQQFRQLSEIPNLSLLSMSIRTPLGRHGAMPVGLPMLVKQPAQVFHNYDAALDFARSEIHMLRHAAIWRSGRTVHS